MTALQVDIHCRALDNFRLQVRQTFAQRGVTAVYGPSGSGKSTLLDCIAGLRTPDAGSEIRFGEDLWHHEGGTLPTWRRRIGYVFSDARLFPHLTLEQNLRYAIKRSAQAPAYTMEHIVEGLDISELLPRMPDTLSAGQRQRGAIARALMATPKLLLLDEPFANLDRDSRQRCLHLLQQLVRELEIPVLYVSHDMDEVSELADYLLLLQDGQVADEGPLIELCSKLDTRLAQDERAAAILEANVIGHDEQYQLTELQVEGNTLRVTRLPRRVGDGQRIRIPARDVSICRQAPVDSSILNVLPVTIDAMQESAGSRLTLRLALGSQHLLARITRKSAEALRLQAGDQVFAQIKSVALVSAPIK